MSERLNERLMVELMDQTMWDLLNITRELWDLLDSMPTFMMKNSL